MCLVMSKLTFVFPISKRNIPFIPYRLSVRVVSSERAGCGKTLVVRRLSESLVQLGVNDAVLSYLRDREADVPLCISVPIYGPAVDQCSVVESLLPYMVVPDLPISRIFHLDVHPSVLNAFFLDNMLKRTFMNVYHRNVLKRVEIATILEMFELHKIFFIPQKIH